ncbi:16102_t:CDS:2 [Funneliformis mosseae]|uniref:deoxyhypusine synthase n=1 Tax=Funneliformis mosseae TaxID=27381 RepID=A0A9N9AYE6_FUNMO|nr:16102_t:CDS:2 [Funneliformis mosseae]
MEKSTSLNGNNEKSKDEILAALKTATTSVFLRSTPMPENAMTVKGPDFNQQLSLHELLDVYCPALTDGSLGDLIYFHTFKNPGLVIDIVSDIRSINQQAVFAKKTGVIILGQEFDGSDSGARPDEAVSWGKIRTDAEHVKVYADATIVFPLIVSETFVKEVLD